ncbi:phosphotransferase [Micrococcus sp.]|uniref:phosphotransferase n=1 Tax=Micrococcus sp. TaxID=1271 RepID=UPI0026DB4C14|nr:phosphotransferase [Micrococcus sp.]MDO4240026.1 phosphotransferase [Micrococcus sp.]
MHRQPLHLAALAAAAVPGLSPAAVEPSPDDTADFATAVVVDTAGERWRVRSPRTAEAGIRLETEVQVLAGFDAHLRAGLPFRVPSVAGAVRVDGLRTFVHQDLPGSPVPLEEIVGLGEPAVQDLGRILAAIHTLPMTVVEQADLPVYTADHVRERHLSGLDAAAATGKVPPVLLRRWEEALEEDGLWEFTPVPVHGDLHEDSLLVERGRVVGVAVWTDLHVGDPATDFAWLAAAEDPDFPERVLDAYLARRVAEGAADDGDAHLLRRASLLAEFAIGQWLLRGVERGDADMVADAQGLLAELADAVRAAESPAPSALRTGVDPDDDGWDDDWQDVDRDVVETDVQDPDDDDPEDGRETTTLTVVRPRD